MKVGIVTWHKGNIGGTLQAYALATTIRKYGYEPELLNLINNKYEPLIKKIRSVLFHIIYTKSGLTRDNTYKFIKENIPESPNLLYSELDKYSDNLMAVICGSDQIWSCVNEVNPFYFLQFVDKKRRISYAPSIGLNYIKEEYQNDFIRYVSSIPYLSVRENKGAEIIHDLTGLSPKVVLDPTLLLNKNEWLKVADNNTVKKYGLEHNGYILCYYLGNHRKYLDYTKRLSQYTKKRIVYVSFKRKNFGKEQVICRIEEFIALVRDAYCILTDSFHGTVIPINLEKKIAVFERFDDTDPMNQNSRIYSILKKIGAEDWIISPKDDVTSFVKREDNYLEIQTKLMAERESSLSYLLESLANACN